MTFQNTPTNVSAQQPGEILMEEDIHERMRPSVVCPQCGDISYLRNWIDGGCDWCAYNPERIKIAEITADDVLDAEEETGMDQNRGEKQ